MIASFGQRTSEPCLLDWGGVGISNGAVKVGLWAEDAVSSFAKRTFLSVSGVITHFLVTIGKRYLKVCLPKIAYFRANRGGACGVITPANGGTEAIAKEVVTALAFRFTLVSSDSPERANTPQKDPRKITNPG